MPTSQISETAIAVVETLNDVGGAQYNGENCVITQIVNEVAETARRLRAVAEASMSSLQTIIHNGNNYNVAVANLHSLAFSKKDGPPHPLNIPAAAVVTPSDDNEERLSPEVEGALEEQVKWFVGKRIGDALVRFDQRRDEVVKYRTERLLKDLGLIRRK